MELTAPVADEITTIQREEYENKYSTDPWCLAGGLGVE